MGERIASYTVTETLGRGGYGEVLAAVHDVLKRDVAIKVLHAKWSDDPEAVRRFVAEARAVNAVRHPNIVDVVDFGTLEDGRHYHVMERLRGESLRARLDARGAMSLEEATPILRAVAAALDAAHDAGIVHRDVKPENVFIHEAGEREVIKLIDFGLAKLASTDLVPTQSGVIMGTPAYMAPEQCRGQPVDHRTDSYAFGVLVYEMLTGRVPLKGDDPVATLLAHVHETPAPPSTLAPLPRAVDAVVMALLAKAPAERPAELVRVVDALTACDGRPLRPRSRVLWFAVGAAALATGTLALSARSHREPAASPAVVAPAVVAPVVSAPVVSQPPPPEPAMVPVDATPAAPDARHAKRARVSPEALENPYP